MQTLDKILAHKAAPKVPEWPSYGYFRQVTQTRIFWKSAAQKHFAVTGIIPQLVCF